MSDVTELIGSAPSKPGIRAKQSQCRSAKHVGWQQYIVVGGVEKTAAYVRHGKTEEHYRTTIGGNDSGESAGGGNSKHSCPFDIEAEIRGIEVTQEQDVQWLCE